MFALIMQHPLPFIVLAAAPSFVLFWWSPVVCILQKSPAPAKKLAYWTYRAYAPILVAIAGFVLAIGVATILNQNFTGLVADDLAGAVLFNGPAMPIFIGIALGSLFLIQNPVDLILKAATNDRLPKQPRLVYCSHTKYAIPLTALGIFCMALTAAYTFDKELMRSTRDAVGLFAVYFCVCWAAVFDLLVAFTLRKAMVNFSMSNEGLNEFDKRLVRVTVGFGGEIIGQAILFSLTLSMIAYSTASYLTYLVFHPWF